LYSKIHHSVADGISAMRMGMRALSPDPDERNLPPLWARPQKRREVGLPNVADMASGLARLSAGLSAQVTTMPTVIREVVRSVKRAKKDADYVSVFQAPDCVLNTRITGSRRFAAQSYSLPRIRNIARVMNCTINDVVLSICGGALREYLITQRALPDRPLIAMVPMSLRQDDSVGGNQIAMILANLGTHIADPAHRLSVVRASVQDAKDRFGQMTPAEILNYTALTLAPGGLHLLTGAAPSWLAFNVVISNVPGPREPLYWNGARLQGMYPVSIVLDRMALNITLTSYVDSLEFGIIACRRTLPSVQRLLDYLEKSIQELEMAAGINH
ncbi:MAG: wax ester/triacylglycerol synthase family O-acyltransferase, partial [Pseudomonadales bacterium]|nr:wax ester/triacylglycerol synthase family O-acyltransferase [Pseudomonadales bacterium]